MGIGLILVTATIGIAGVGTMFVATMSPGYSKGARVAMGGFGMLLIAAFAVAAMWLWRLFSMGPNLAK